MDINGLVGKAEAVHAGKASQGMNSVPSMGKQIFCRTAVIVT